LKTLLPIALLLLTTACARAPFAPMEAASMAPVSGQALVEKCWPDADGVYRVRQTALLEVGFREFAMDGVLILNLGQQSARLVGMSSMGIKFFDIEVIGDTVTPHYIFPELNKIPGLADRIGEAVKRLYLSPLPAPTDEMAAGEAQQVLTRTVDGTRYRFVFGGKDRLLAEKSAAGKSEKWTARYYDYTQSSDRWIPGGIFYRDSRGRYSLTLWTEKVEKK
jgi:hypothetical protein